jgi:tyrosyl-tRNA synthetase
VSLLLSFIRWDTVTDLDDYSVKNRMTKGDGMSFAEFTYPLLQAWDWWVLFRKGVQVQVGGSDQYGNILFGMDAVKSISKNTAMEQDQNPLEDDLDKPIGFTTPLLTAANGEKFGKSAGNAVWLDKDMTSTFELYQVSPSRSQMACAGIINFA